MIKKHKKLIIVSSVVILIVVILFFLLSLNKKEGSKSFFQNTIPLLDKNNQNTKDEDVVIYPPINPAQTNYKQVANQIPIQKSESEKDKIIDQLPYRINGFITGSKINTTINVFTLESDPPQSVRLEIYGPNYNNAGLLSEDAKAFNASFKEVKKFFDQNEVNLANLQIIYGNRQYIQDTATLWVKEFGLLD